MRALRHAVKMALSCRSFRSNQDQTAAKLLTSLKIVLFVKAWNDLQLNAKKSEAVILSAVPQIQLAAIMRMVEVTGSRLQVTAKLKSLNVTTDSRLKLNCHARDVATACNYHMPSLVFNDLAQTLGVQY